MPIRIDLKAIPEVAVLPIDHRVRIERRSLYLAATDWWTIFAAVVGGCLPLMLGEGLPEELSEGQQWLIASVVGVGGVLFFLLVFFARANHHAVRIARLATSLVLRGDPTVPPKNHTPARKVDPLPGWRKAAGIVGLCGGLSFFYLGTVTPRGDMLAVGAVALMAGGILGTSWNLCRVCQNVNVGLWSRSDRCSSCGTAFRKSGEPED